MSTQTLQPLIWLARSSTRPSVRDGTPPFSADALRACRACKASGTIIAMFVIPACIITLPFLFHSTVTPSRLGAVRPELRPSDKRRMGKLKPHRRNTKKVNIFSNKIETGIMVRLREERDEIAKPWQDA